jgi:hypothetical protein
MFFEQFLRIVDFFFAFLSGTELLYQKSKIKAFTSPRSIQNAEDPKSGL